MRDSNPRPTACKADALATAPIAPPAPSVSPIDGTSSSGLPCGRGRLGDRRFRRPAAAEGAVELDNRGEAGVAEFGEGEFGGEEETLGIEDFNIVRHARIIAQFGEFEAGTFGGDGLVLGGDLFAEFPDGDEGVFDFAEGALNCLLVRNERGFALPSLERPGALGPPVRVCNRRRSSAAARARAGASRIRIASPFVPSGTVAAVAGSSNCFRAGDAESASFAAEGQHPSSELKHGL